MKAQITKGLMNITLAVGLFTIANPASASGENEIRPCPAIYISTESTVIGTLQSEAYKAQRFQAGFGGLQNVRIEESEGCLTRKVHVQDSSGNTLTFFAEYDLREHKYKVQLLVP